MAVDFTQILSKQVGTAPEPKPLPSGTYIGTVAGLPSSRIVKTKEGEKGVVSITFSLTEAMDDVDQDELAAAGGLVRNDGEAKTVRTEFWLDESSMYQLDRFLAGFGFKEDSGKSYEEVFQELPGREVTVAVELREYTTKNGDARSVNEVRRAYANA